LNESCHTCEWVMAHIWMSHVAHDTHKKDLPTHMNGISCRHTLGVLTSHTYEYVGSHMWMRHVVHVDESGHTFEWFISHMTHMRETRPHTWAASPVATLYACWRVTHILTSHTYECVGSHMWMNRVSHVDESCHTCGMSDVTHLNESYRTWHTWKRHAHTHERHFLSPHSMRAHETHTWMRHVAYVNESRRT